MWKRILSLIIIALLRLTSGEVNVKWAVNDSPFDRIGNCSSTGSYLPNSIFVIVFSSPTLEDKLDFTFQLTSLKFYCDRHGYNFRVVNPDPILAKYAHVPTGIGARITSSKPLLMLYSMRLLYTRYGCKISWILFVDIDVHAVDFDRPIFSLIESAEDVSMGDENHCRIIAQDSPTTINTGIMLIRVTEFSDQFVSSWVENQWISTNKDIFWQDDQGWFQQTFLEYAARELLQTLAFDCALDKIYRLLIPDKAHTKTRFSENSLRSYCYARNLYYLGLYPGRRSVGHVCLMSGLTRDDRFNAKDWPGSPWGADPEDQEGQLSQQQGELLGATGVGSVYRHVMVSLAEDMGVQQRSASAGASQKCSIEGIMFYHGKNRQIVQNLHSYMQRIIQRQTDASSNSTMLKQSHPRACPVTDHCAMTLLENSWAAVQFRDWMPLRWRLWEDTLLTDKRHSDKMNPAQLKTTRASAQVLASVQKVMQRHCRRKQLVANSTAS